MSPKISDLVIYVGYNSDSNGHTDQPAVICGIVSASSTPPVVNLMVFKDAAECESQQYVKWYPNEGDAVADLGSAYGILPCCFPN